MNIKKHSLVLLQLVVDLVALLVVLNHMQDIEVNYLQLQQLLKLQKELQMDVLDLSPEQVSLAFLVLKNQAPLPHSLENLSEKNWEELAQLLCLLEIEKQHSNLH